jgi:hypothetical protein
MSISTITTLAVPSGSMNSTIPLYSSSAESKGTSEEKSLAGDTLLSGVTGLVFSLQLTDLSFSSTETSFAYRKDDSLAVQAYSQTNFKARTEEYRFDITLSAESLGLDKSAFANSNKPMTIQLLYSQSELQISQKIAIKEIKTLRTPQEIIQDLVAALTDVLKDTGNKSVSYVLDSEAMQSLVQSDPKMARLFSELVMVMAMVNLMKKQNESSNDYTIFLSGKGKPYLDIQQEIDGEMVNQSYQFTITILPPKAEEEHQAVEIKTDSVELSENPSTKTN